jgi:hypothetical protein
MKSNNSPYCQVQSLKQYFCTLYKIVIWQIFVRVLTLFLCYFMTIISYSALLLQLISNRLRNINKIMTAD